MLLNLILVLQVMYVDSLQPGGINSSLGYACMVIDKEHLEDMDLLFFAAEMTSLDTKRFRSYVNKPVSIKGYRDFDLQEFTHFNV